MSVVTVLTPNGRRQNVKITPNTTLLQVLEEVCLKHGLKPEDYDIRHHNKILDVSAIFRYSGLPNNAFLEMTEATKQRSESPVVLGLHLESGERLTGEFLPSDNLWHVIITLKPDTKSLSSPVIIYTRKEVCGEENLKKTTLRSLGLTGGRAILRLFNRTPDELRMQASVSKNLCHDIGASCTKDDKSSPVNHPNKSPPSRIKRTSIPEKKTIEKEEKKRDIKPSTPKEAKSLYTNEEPDVPTEKLVESKNVKEVKGSIPEISAKDISNNNIQGNATEEKKMSVDNTLSTIVEEEGRNRVILLGERNAVAYNLNKVKPVVFEEEPDEFYELTISDAKLLLRDAKQLCAEIENSPLMTSAQRELERNKKILSLLNQYKKTVIRIKFPDRTVLQGTFSSVEKISAVEKFVAEYLEQPDTSFYLYTTPPKEVLKSDSNLLECNCVPCAVVYFGVYSGKGESKQFLRSDVIQKFSTPSAAALTAYQSRGMILNQDRENKETGFNDLPLKEVISVAGPSTSASPSKDKQSREQENSPPFKVPKWFKMKK